MSWRSANYLVERDGKRNIERSVGLEGRWFLGGDFIEEKEEMKEDTYDDEILGRNIFERDLMLETSKINRNIRLRYQNLF